jgi:hypothetical protein
VRQFFSTYHLVEPLNPRDSFYGGRTECFCRYFKAASHQKIRYIDFTSVYPYIQKNLPLPVGHPEIITKDFKSLDEYIGLIKNKVLAPRKLNVNVNVNVNVKVRIIVNVNVNVNVEVRVM